MPKHNTRDNNKPRVPLAYKIYFIVLISVGFCALFISALSYYQDKGSLGEYLGSSLEKIARTAVLSIDGDALSYIESAKDPAYEDLRLFLLDVKNYNEISTPLYILRKADNNNASVLVTTEQGSMVGARYRLNPTLREIFNTGKSSFSPIYTDKNGTWISAYAPISDSEGAIVGVLELDYHIQHFIKKLRYKLLKTALLCVLGLMIGTFLGIPLLNPILHSINILNIAASEIMKGNYDYEIELKSSDEIGHLAVVFEKMRKSIKDYTEQLKDAWLKEKKTHLASVKALTEAIAIREPHMKGHIQRVSRYAELVAREMGLSEHETETVRYGCMLHDIGKIGIDINILKKPSELTPSEYEKMKKHPYLGTQIMSELEFLESARDAVLHHQERYDGKGYPEGLKGEEIPIAARIVAVVDAYDAMASDRPYREKINQKDVIESIKGESGKQFDPKVVDAFLKVIDKL